MEPLEQKQQNIRCDSGEHLGDFMSAPVSVLQTMKSVRVCVEICYLAETIILQAERRATLRCDFLISFLVT